MKKNLLIILVVTTIMIWGYSMTAFASNSLFPISISENSDTGAEITQLPAPPSPPPEAPTTGDEGERESVSLTPSMTPSMTPHAHNYEWKTTEEPAEDKDGLSKCICDCGDVVASQPISAGHAYVKGIFEQIENAPENGTIVISPGEYRCYTAKVMETLKKRPDIILKTVYSDKDGTEKSFSITAADIMNETDMFYGFTYLGNTYGWD